MMRMVPEEAVSRIPSHPSTAYTRQGLVPPPRVPQPIVFPRVCQYLPMVVPVLVLVSELVSLMLIQGIISFQAKSIPLLATLEKVFWLKATTVMELSSVVVVLQEATEANISIIRPPASIDPPSRNLREGLLHHFLPSQNCHK